MRRQQGEKEAREDERWRERQTQVRRARAQDKVMENDTNRNRAGEERMRSHGSHARPGEATSTRLEGTKVADTRLGTD